MSLLTSLLTFSLPFTRVARPPILHELHLTIPTWAHNPLRMQQLIVFNVMPQAISVSTPPSTNAPVVANELLATHNIAVSKIMVLSANVSPTWPATAPIDIAPSATLPITFSSTVLLRRTLARASSSTTGIPRDFDVVPVVQIFEGGIVTV